MFFDEDHPDFVNLKTNEEVDEMFNQLKEIDGKLSEPVLDKKQDMNYIEGNLATCIKSMLYSLHCVRITPVSLLKHADKA